jgi:Family of unknown function (DUF5681)
MNSNLAKVGKPTRWSPGKSGNPAGKPPGTRKLVGRSLRNQLTVAVAVQLFIFQWLARSDAASIFLHVQAALPTVHKSVVL